MSEPLYKPGQSPAELAFLAVFPDGCMPPPSRSIAAPARHVATGEEVPVDVVYEPVAGSDTLLSVTLRPHPAPEPVPAPTVDAGLVAWSGMGVDLEGLIQALAVAAWDEGADAGVVWCPDADMTKRGVVPMTQEEGLEHSRAHFAEHGAGSPTAPFSIAMHNLRAALAKLEPKP